jgi:hypothetical protein
MASHRLRAKGSPPDRRVESVEIYVPLGHLPVTGD